MTDIDFQAVFEATPNLFLLLSPDLNIVGASNAYLEATMVHRQDVIGKNLFDVFPDNPDDPSSKGTAHLKASLDRVRARRLPDSMAIQKYDVRRPESQGGGFEERHWSPLNTPVLDHDGKLLYILHRVEDVTDLVKLKRERVEAYRINEELMTEKDRLEKLRQSQRLEAMGALAGGVAHDFNNILSVILMTCESVLRGHKIPDEVRGELREVISSGERAAALTRQLLAFSRKQVLQPRPLNLNGVVDGIYEMLKRLVKENIEFSVLPGKDLKNIKVDQGQLEQVILNLVVNSRDAMPQGGKITIETQNVVLDKAMAAGNMRVEPGPYVMLAVRDTGVGMDANTQARIFEPFFTTKSQGSGTGLGLATVYGIVTQNKGSIWVYSEPNKGTVFKIYFPQIDAAIEKADAPQASALTKKVTGTLVLVEDQDPLRRIMNSILTKEGFTVHEAPNGLEALKLLQKIDFKADLIVTDVIMPELGGQQLASRIKSLGHKIDFLFLSGFTGDVVLDVDTSDGTPNFLEKPFNHRALLDKVQSILAKR